MVHSERPLIALLFCASVFGCTQPSADLRPATASERAEIQGLFDRVVAAAATGRADSLMSLYADDAVWMLPDRWADTDKAEASDFYEEVLAWGRPDPDSYDIALDEVLVGLDWAVVRHTDRGVFLLRDGSGSVRQGSRHVSVLSRDHDGRWKIARDIFINPPVDAP